MADVRPEHAALGWISTIALDGGVVSYLVGRFLFIRVTVRSTSPAQVVAIGVAVVLLPVSRLLPGLASLGLLTVFVTALVCYERLTQYSRMVLSE